MRLSMEAILADACSTSSLVDSDSGAEAAAGGSGSACMNNGVARRGFIASFGAPASWKALHDAQNTKRSAAKVLILCFGLFDTGDRHWRSEVHDRNEGRDDCVAEGGVPTGGVGGGVSKKKSQQVVQRSDKEPWALLEPSHDYLQNTQHVPRNSLN